MPNDSKEKIMNVDFFDLCWEATKRGEGLYDQERIERLIARCAEELMNYDVDGIMYYAHNSHTGLTVVSGEPDGEDLYGYNPPVVEAFQRRYGVDILKQDFDHEAWYKLLGEFLTRYLQEARGDELDKRGKKIIVAVKW